MRVTRRPIYLTLLVTLLGRSRRFDSNPHAGQLRSPVLEKLTCAPQAGQNGNWYDVFMYIAKAMLWKRWWGAKRVAVEPSPWFAGKMWNAWLCSRKREK